MLMYHMPYVDGGKEGYSYTTDANRYVLYTIHL